MADTGPASSPTAAEIIGQLLGTPETRVRTAAARRSGHRRTRPGRIAARPGDRVRPDIRHPLPGKGVTGPGTLALAPFRQIRERGLECHDDATPLQVLEVERAHRIDTDELLATLPDAPATLSGAGSGLDDDAYAAVVVLGIFLGCQLLSSRLGLTVSRGEQPQQRTQRTTDALGSPATVGFYNSFSVRAGGGPAEALHRAGAKLCRRPGTDEVIAPRGPDVAGVQFRPESVLSRSGAELSWA